MHLTVPVSPDVHVREVFVVLPLSSLLPPRLQRPLLPLPVELALYLPVNKFQSVSLRAVPFQTVWGQVGSLFKIARGEGIKKRLNVLMTGHWASGKNFMPGLRRLH